MKTRNILIAVVVACLSVAAVPFVYAQHPGHGHGDGFAGTMMLGHLARAQQELGLSDQQVADIKAIFQQVREQNAPYRTQLRGGMAAIAQTLIKNPSDVSAAQALLDQQEQVERTMKSNTLAAASKALSVLTPDQRTKLGQLLADRMARHQSKQ